MLFVCGRYGIALRYKMTVKLTRSGLWFLVLAVILAPSLFVRAVEQDEQSAFRSANQGSDGTAKAVKLESFLKQYPNSVFEEQVLEALLDTYKRVGDLSKYAATATRLLEKNPDNLMGLWAEAKLFSYTGPYGPDAFSDAYKENLELAKRGLRILDALSTPPGASATISEKQKSEMRSAFNFVAGSIYVRTKEFNDAQRYLRPAIEADSNNFGGAYDLALAYFSSNPPAPAQGLFFLARAWNLMPENGRQRLDAYGAEQCIKYYGSDRSWPSVKSIAKSRTTPPPGFRVE
jgi:tetratricopeptide (TPR) repeat protein